MKPDPTDKFRLINIIGIDGAGKTTLAKRLAKHLSQDGNRVRYVYCQYFAKLLFPIKWLAKKTVMRRSVLPVCCDGRCAEQSCSSGFQCMSDTRKHRPVRQRWALFQPAPLTTLDERFCCDHAWIW